MKTVYYSDDFIIFIVPGLIVKRSNSTNLFITGRETVVVVRSLLLLRFLAIRYSVERAMMLCFLFNFIFLFCLDECGVRARVYFFSLLVLT